MPSRAASCEPVSLREREVRAGVLGDVELGLLLKLLGVVLVFLGDAGLEGVVGLGLDQQLADGLQHAQQLGRGFPVLGLEDA